MATAPEVRVCFVPATAVPLVTVVMVWLAQPLLPVNVNGPTPPLLILVRVNVGAISLLLMVQVGAWPLTIVRLLLASVPPTQLQVPAKYPAGLASVKT